MSYQRPIFNTGLYGKANASVMNGLMDSADAVFDNEEGLRWAQQQVIRGELQLRFLAKLTAATVLLPNRWEYVFEPFVIHTAAASRVPATLTAGTWGSSTGDATTKAVNIRELRNTAGFIDGSVLPAGASIGPVGSFYSAGWVTTGLEGYVYMHVDTDKQGGLVHWFDAPNPIDCGE